MFTRAYILAWLCAGSLLLGAASSAVYAQQANERAAPKCAEGEELDDDDLCYPKCKDKYKGEGPVCKEICGPNTQDHDTHCLSGPAVFRKKKYDRGPGHPPG